MAPLVTGPSTRRRAKFVELAWQTGMAALAILAWQFIPPLLGTSDLVLPRLSAVLAAAAAPLPGGETIWVHILVTGREVAAAFAIAAVAGTTAGMLIGSSRLAHAVAGPLLTGLFAVPLITLIPLFLVIFGIGEASKIAFAALYAFFPIILSTTVGVANVEQEHRLVGQAFGLPWAQRLRKIVLRSASRQMFSGLQMGMAIAIVAVMSAEVFGAASGLGYLIERSAQDLKTSAVWFLVLVTLALSWIPLQGIRLLARLMRVHLDTHEGR